MLRALLFGSAVAGIGLLWVARPLFFHVLPLAWTGEAARLADVLGVDAGRRVADVGAGTGALAAEMAERVGPDGAVFATELDSVRRERLARRASTTPQIKVIAAAPDETNLAPDCCDAVYLRAVLHHIDAPGVYARALVRAVRPGGRVAVIDFAPGLLPFHGADHGITAQTVIDAFTAAGLRLERRDDEWGGAMYMLAFRK
jgi:ubiquinone/menaquinone biosynthesis C-methylase UbiE